ncbi:glycosyltransferase family 1 protein [Isoptericola sp. b441]|uniref:Glycosyltransferase family 1 protein n=1 Tax=Actinotalea lenta TaxID=3064654 RepID=A0ABT9D7W2_9CELL|nr:MULTISPECIES: glycosyltransferase family 1 protein [unclassified Isoptericola]MDO8106957.1 glycosyltransferase family 1 protein [Isoptericola sp. b441]MDO8121333.1 glycosyltransferase family 1 protein [Isoptericola sp. b490]
MAVAVKYAGSFVEDGHVGGHDAGATLVRRLMRVFPEAKLVGGRARHAEGFDVVPLEYLDPSDTVVINMDVVDSMAVWRTLAVGGGEPRVMNFVWWNTSQFTHPVQRASLALSCALFPTFANSQRTATEVREIVAQLTVPQLAEKSRIAWANLGIRLEHVQPREEPTVPIVLYPAIYLSDRKQPQVFLDVVERVHRRTPINVEARLHESHLISEKAMRLSRKDWAWVGPLTATREDYYHHLARTTAFLATAVEESYGLEYVEAMVAGAVGVFPDRPWARALLPEGYPFLYTDVAHAEELLFRAVTDTAACRAELNTLVGGDFVAWLRTRHDDSRFEQQIADAVHGWFGEG